MSAQCLACNHVNRSDAKFCVECGSRLNLKLCAQCEAINESRAATCHACGQVFPAPEPVGATATAQQLDVLEADGPASRLPAYRAAASRERRSAVRVKAAALLGVLVVAGGAAYLVHRTPTMSTPATQAAAGAPVAEAAPVEKANALPAVAGTIAAPVETKVAPKAEPVSAAPVAKRASAAPAPAAKATAAAVVAMPMQAPAVARSAVPVTHTKRTEAAPAAPSAPELKQVTAPEPVSPAPKSNCTEATLALGLCKPQ